MGQMSRFETYTLAIVTVFLSVYLKRILSILTRGWLAGRRNILQTELGEVTAMHDNLNVLIPSSSILMIRVLLPGFLAVLLRVDASHPFLGGAMLGLFIGQTRNVLLKFHHLLWFDTYAPATTAKIQELQTKVEQKKAIAVPEIKD